MGSTHFFSKMHSPNSAIRRSPTICVTSVNTRKRTMTACEENFNNALFCSLAFWKPEVSLLVVFAYRKTTVQFDGRRSNGFSCTPLERSCCSWPKGKFFILEGTTNTRDPIPVHTLTIYWPTRGKLLPLRGSLIVAASCLEASSSYACDWRLS